MGGFEGPDAETLLTKGWVEAVVVEVVIASKMLSSNDRLDKAEIIANKYKDPSGRSAYDSPSNQPLFMNVDEWPQLDPFWKGRETKEYFRMTERSGSVAGIWRRGIDMIG